MDGSHGEGGVGGCLWCLVGIEVADDSFGGQLGVVVVGIGGDGPLAIAEVIPWSVEPTDPEIPGGRPSSWNSDGVGCDGADDGPDVLMIVSITVGGGSWVCAAGSDLAVVPEGEVEEEQVVLAHVDGVGVPGDHVDVGACSLELLVARVDVALIGLGGWEVGCPEVDCIFDCVEVGLEHGIEVHGVDEEGNGNLRTHTGVGHLESEPQQLVVFDRLAEISANDSGSFGIALVSMEQSALHEGIGEVSIDHIRCEVSSITNSSS